MLSDDERFTVEHIRAFARGDSSSWAGWTRSLVAIIDRLLAARSPAPTCDCGAPAATSCVGCLQAEYQAAHPDCASCCPLAAPILEEREADATLTMEAES